MLSTFSVDNTGNVREHLACERVNIKVLFFNMLMGCVICLILQFDTTVNIFSYKTPFDHNSG
ncbi:hypothetical protein VIAG107301_02785 [Vibrio agarivorans]